MTVSNNKKKTKFENKQNASLKKISEVFNKLKRRKESVKSQKAKSIIEKGTQKEHKHLGKANTYSSYQRYETQMKSFFKELGVSDLKEITPQLIENYVQKEIELFKTPIIVEHNGVKEEIYPKEHLEAAERLNNNLSALKSFQLGIETTNVLGVNAKKSVDFGDIQKFRDMATEAKVFRAKGGSSWLNPDNRQCRTLKDRLNKEAAETKNPLDQMAADFVKYQLITGARPQNGIKQTKDSFIKNSDGSMYVVHKKDKGDKTRVVKITDKDDVKFLEDLIGKHDDFRVFRGYKQNGGYMSADSLLKRIGEKVKEQSSDIKGESKVKVKGNKQEYTVKTEYKLHSNRKNYATNETIRYYNHFMKNPRETEKRIEMAIEERHKMEKEVYEKFKKEIPNPNKSQQKFLDGLKPTTKAKYKALVHQQNERNRKNAEKRGDKNYKKVKNLSSENASKFLASVCLGHARVDVVNDSYLNFDTWNKVLAKYKK